MTGLRSTPRNAILMRMRLACAAKSARSGGACAGRRRLVAGCTRCKNGKLLGQPLRFAMRARRPFPLRRADQNFAVLAAILTVKFVDWHECSIAGNDHLTSDPKSAKAWRVKRRGLCFSESMTLRPARTISSLANARRTNRRWLPRPTPRPSNHEPCPPSQSALRSRRFLLRVG